MIRVRCEFPRSEVPSPCPRKTLEHGCTGCQDAINERASILQFGQGTGCNDLKDPHSERVSIPTVRDPKTGKPDTSDADRMAREPVVAELRWFGTQARLL